MDLEEARHFFARRKSTVGPHKF